MERQNVTAHVLAVAFAAGFAAAFGLLYGLLGFVAFQIIRIAARQLNVHSVFIAAVVSGTVLFLISAAAMYTTQIQYPSSDWFEETVETYPDTWQERVVDQYRLLNETISFRRHLTPTSFLTDR